MKEIELEVLTRPGRYKPVAGNLQVKEVVVGEGERRRRYVFCLNTEAAERQRLHREQVLVEITAELNLLREHEDDDPKAACALLASRRYGRNLSTDYLGRPRLDAAKVKAAEKFDGKAMTDGGIRKDNIQAFSVLLDVLNDGRLKLGRSDAVAVDEVGQIGTRQMQDLLRHRDAMGFSIVGLGDNRHCSSIEAGEIISFSRRALGGCADRLQRPRQDGRPCD